MIRPGPRRLVSEFLELAKARGSTAVMDADSDALSGDNLRRGDNEQRGEASRSLFWLVSAVLFPFRFDFPGPEYPFQDDPHLLS
jgi:hypothetical protein